MIPMAQTKTKTNAGANASANPVEWPTWLVIFLVHAAWLVLLVHYQAIGPALAAPLLVLTLTWHSSVCHEILHGHPTRSDRLNDLLAQLPLSLLVPYFTYKESHLRHHRNDRLTLPGVDPESFFTAPGAWRKAGATGRALAWAGMTLGGRMALGPGIAFCRLPAGMGRDMRARRWRRLALYFVHFFSGRGDCNSRPPLVSDPAVAVPAHRLPVAVAADAAFLL